MIKCTLLQVAILVFLTGCGIQGQVLPLLWIVLWYCKRPSGCSLRSILSPEPWLYCRQLKFVSGKQPCFALRGDHMKLWITKARPKKIRDSRARAHQKIPPRDFSLVDLIHASHAFVLAFHARSIAPTTRVGRQASCPCSPHVHQKRIHEGHERNRIWRRESIFCRESIFYDSWP